MKFREDYVSDSNICIGPVWEEFGSGEFSTQLLKGNNFKSKLLFDFSITYKQKIIETNVSLSKILKRLDKKFEFFQRNKQG